MHDCERNASVVTVPVVLLILVLSDTHEARFAFLLACLRSIDWRSVPQRRSQKGQPFVFRLQRIWMREQGNRREDMCQRTGIVERASR